MYTEACLGYSVMGHQSSQQAFEPYGASRSIPVRLMGQASEEHTGAKTKSARRAKVGYCLCSTRLIHAAVPPAFDLLSLDRLKARKMQLRMDHGPWSGRRQAAQSYNTANRNLPTTCGWAAASLGMELSSPLAATTSAAHAPASPKPEMGQRPPSTFL